MNPFKKHPLTQSLFFQLSLLWPFVIWCVILIVLSITEDRSQMFVFNKILEAYPIFVPYGIFAAVLWKWADKRPFRQLVLIALVAPVLWGIFFMFAHMLYLYLKEQTIAQFAVLIIMAFWAVVVAYLAEIIPLILLTIFKDDFNPEQHDSGPKIRQNFVDKNKQRDMIYQ